MPDHIPEYIIAQICEFLSIHNNRGAIKWLKNVCEVNASPTVGAATAALTAVAQASATSILGIMRMPQIQHTHGTFFIAQDTRTVTYTINYINTNINQRYSEIIEIKY